MLRPKSRDFKGSNLKLPSTEYKDLKINLLNNLVTQKKCKNVFSTNKETSLNTNISSSEKVNIKESKEEKDSRIKKVLKEYFKLESNKLIYQYGSEYLKESKESEKKYRIHSSFMNKHNLKPLSRALMVDWMIEIFYAFNSEASTFFLAVDILDRYLQYTEKNIEDKDIHLIGLACIFIASKSEDLFPFQMKHIVEELGKKKFSEEIILRKEIEIIKEIKFELYNWSTYDYICLQLIDFRNNNKTIIEKYNMINHLESYENCCFFLAKGVQLNNKFTQYLSSIKGLGCLICAFDIVQSNSKTLTDDIIKVFRQWITMLIEESGFKPETINKFYDSLSDYYKKLIKNEEGISFHLCETHTFYFY